MITINGHTRTCGLIGNPVEHSLSPVIHNTLAELTGENLAYTTFHVPTGYIGEAVKGAYALNLLGMNVTVPYKSDVIEHLKEIDPMAEQIGAVNTLVRTEGGFKGYNTDNPGLYRAMCADGVEIKGEKVLILGAGGVARAVAMLMVQKEATQVVLLNRTVERAQSLADEVNKATGQNKVTALALEEYRQLDAREKYLAIQATSVGMHPNVEDVVIRDEAFYQMIHTGYDLIFNPWETCFMKLVRKQGGRAFNGARMLLYQGIIAYELWTGKAVLEEHAAIVYEKMCEAMGV